MKNKKVLFIILTFLWMVIIFGFLLQPVEVSQGLSKMLAKTLSILFVIVGFEQDGLTPKDQLEYYNFVLRRCAHFFVYLILGILCAVTFAKAKIRHKYAYAVCLCVLVATVGEIAQLFIDGRTAKVQDVLLNIVGAIVGVLLVNFIERIHKKLK